MNILTDQHHADLLYGLQRLFEDRLGYNLFVPKGHAWWDAGYWQFGHAIASDDRLARQYLDTNDTYREVEPGLFLTFDPGHPERPIYGVTLERAQTMEWDAVLASVQENQAGLHRFAQEHDARSLYQIGNARQQVDWSLDPLVLNAAEAPMEGRGVYIGQEFDYQTVFRARKPIQSNRISSFVNLLSGIPESWEPFAGLRDRLPEYEFRHYGHQAVQAAEPTDGNLHPVSAIALEMALAEWAYHSKPTGDGFGHIIHNWAAIGRPLIGHAHFYAGQRAEALWQDGVTCIDLDRHSLDEAADIIRNTTPERHEEMCRAIRTTLESIYDPAADAEAVADLLRGA